MHPAQHRYLAEDLVRLRRSDERRRYTASQRAGKIDANPHQIDAVIFALARLREGGCILADEVGLGKTIEAGLVLAQLRAEGARRVLLVAPKPLLGQWRQELFQLFDIEAREASARAADLEGEGVFLIGREAAGGEAGRDALLACDPFELCIIDEAHELFANIYKRFDKFGEYREDSASARTAGRLREVLLHHHTPVLLLTATPIQNSLEELWGLVQYVDPLGTLLGDLPTFREVFCNPVDRQVIEAQEQELRLRLKQVLQRTLRRQAKEFLEQPFVPRQARLFEYTMSPAEKQLYDHVTAYLLERGTYAFEGRHRHLHVLNMHRRLASSPPAFAASLRNIARRLRLKLERHAGEASELEALRGDAQDFEDDELDSQLAAAGEHAAEEPVHVADSIRAELERVEGFVRQAEALGKNDAKFDALLKALDFVTERAADRVSGKLVVFTESLATQDYLRERLVASGRVKKGEVTLFRGDNDSPEAHAALERWRKEVPQTGAEPSVEIATRLALVHEFKTRSRVFISTEAGAKGLNLQFCAIVVNYDLPWNPQRIEQRIGRCHRYGQEHEVTVINFLASDNEAQRLTFEILSQKLELFGAVLDASDRVLHEPTSAAAELLPGALGNNLELELRRIYEHARTLAQVSAELRTLRDQVAQTRRRFEETHARTAQLIEARLDRSVQDVFRQHKRAVPEALAELDRDLLLVVLAYLDAVGVPYQRIHADGADLLQIEASEALPEALRAGTSAAIGFSKQHTSLHVNHPLVLAAVAHARAQRPSACARVQLTAAGSAALRALSGQRARLRLCQLRVDGFEQVELLVPVVVLASGEALTVQLAELLLREPFYETEAFDAGVPGDVLDDACEDALFGVQAELDAAEHRNFERVSRQLERFIDDRCLVLKRRRNTASQKLERAREQRDAATGSEARVASERQIFAAQTELDEVEGALERLARRDDERFQQFHARIHARRYGAPSLSTLFELDLVIA